MLWFKNLMVYRLSRDVSLRAEEMEKQLAAYTFSLAEADMAKPVGFRQWVHKAIP